MKVLLIIEECNPEWASVPLVGYNLFNGISELADVTLVTHERNRMALEGVRNRRNIEYINENPWVSGYYRTVHKLLLKNDANWPMRHLLSYPVYAEFNHKVSARYQNKIKQGHYDVVHSITPMIPRYPVKVVNACKQTPFIIGPVNGGVPFPKGFNKIARKEFAHLNFLRFFCRILPNYSATYKNADKVLAGSTYTLNMLKELFSIDKERISLFYENGINGKFSPSTNRREKYPLRLLFVGRLTPYKGADMLINAVDILDDSIKDRISLTIVGDGQESKNLKNLTEKLGISHIVKFTGWVDNQSTVEYYQNSDIFCFPSVREFGGAVALEAMASGLPCIVVNNGGIGEYITDKTGFKIEPLSAEQITLELSKKITTLFENRELLQEMSKNAVNRAKEFRWEIKAQKIVDIYNELMCKAEFCG
jgi:glycosyltransferase involved in cell wall biosynthesis